MGKKVNIHLQIWLFAPIFMPFFLIYMAIHSVYVFIDKKRYRNRPRPLPKKLRKLLRYLVLDENRRTTTIAEYNYKHGTNFTLDQVYGKGYEASLSDEDKKAVKEELSKHDVPK